MAAAAGGRVAAAQSPQTVSIEWWVRPVRLSDAKGQADSSQPLHCSPDCQTGRLGCINSHTENPVFKGRCWLAGPTRKIQSSSKLRQFRKWQAEILDTPLRLTGIGTSSVESPRELPAGQDEWIRAMLTLASAGKLLVFTGLVLVRANKSPDWI